MTVSSRFSGDRRGGLPSVVVAQQFPANNDLRGSR